MESSHDPRVLIGVGAVETIPKLKIRWPSGTETTLKNVKVDQTLELEEPQSDVSTTAVGPASTPGAPSR
jgi:hypothetical protein